MELPFGLDGDSDDEDEMILEEVLGSGAVETDAPVVNLPERIVFKEGSALLSSFSMCHLESVATKAKKYGDVKIRVEGCAGPDEEGPGKLAAARCKTVFRALVQHGVPIYRLRPTAVSTSLDGPHVQFSAMQELRTKDPVAWEPDSSSLDRNALGRLDPIAAVLVARCQLRIVVEGHTDVKGNDGGRAVSEARAGRVAQHLIDKGVLKDQLIVVGCGTDFPVAVNNSEEGRALNRRVEFHILRRETVFGLRQLASMGPALACAKPLLRQLRYMAAGERLRLDPEIQQASAEMLCGAITGCF